MIVSVNMQTFEWVIDTPEEVSYDEMSNNYDVNLMEKRNNSDAAVYLSY